MFRRLAFLGVPFEVVGGPAEYSGRFRVADLRSEPAALLLNFRKSFWAFRDDAEG